MRSIPVPIGVHNVAVFKAGKCHVFRLLRSKQDLRPILIPAGKYKTVCIIFHQQQGIVPVELRIVPGSHFLVIYLHQRLPGADIEEDQAHGVRGAIQTFRHISPMGNNGPQIPEGHIPTATQQNRPFRLRIIFRAGDFLNGKPGIRGLGQNIQGELVPFGTAFRLSGRRDCGSRSRRGRAFGQGGLGGGRRFRRFGAGSQNQGQNQKNKRKPSFHGKFSFLKQKVVLSIENAGVFQLYSMVILAFCQVLFDIKIIFTKKVPEETFFRDKFHNFSASSSQRRAEASLGIRQSPRGLRHTEPTFTPSGRQLRLNCWEKNRR